MSRVAVILFNLGGPDRPEAVKPFLRNLFGDPAILRVPAVLRKPLALAIAGRRAVAARAIYAKMGGGSPILPNTRAQAEALMAQLGDLGAVRIWPCMRYWHPMAPAVAREVAAFLPERIVLLPLYPQFSTTTTASSLRDWEEAARAAGVSAPTATVCCYPEEPGFSGALAREIRTAITQVPAPLRLLLTAHGLPARVIAAGDPYQWQVERTAAALIGRLGIERLDWRVCYQSRVGPLRWIGPATDAEIRRAGEEGRSLVVAPIAFVSEHSETLVELDIEYSHLAQQAGVPVYRRVPAVGSAPEFIQGLARLVRDALGRMGSLRSATGGRLCPAAFSGCAQQGRTV